MEKQSAPSSWQGSFLEVFWIFLKLGCSSFGGPIAHLGYFHQEFVQQRKWVTESQFSQLLAICQFLPGPASSQLGFTLGLLRAGGLGAMAAFLGFTLPSALLLFSFASSLSLLSGEVGVAIVQGLKLVACAVVADAVLKMWSKLCPDPERRTIAVVAMSVVFMGDSAWFQLFVVLGGAIAGLWAYRGENPEIGDTVQVHYGKKCSFFLFSIFAFFLLFFLLMTPFSQELLAIADAFYRAGALVFGGGHVVLPLLEESVVNTGWISQEAFLSGYGATQAIPGPMFAFSAYLGAIIPTSSSSWVVASLALCFIFLPGFLLVTAILPIWQRVYYSSKVFRAIAGVNAAVVGLLAAALYDPIFTSGVQSRIDLAIVTLSLGLLAIWKLSPLVIVLWSVLAKILLLLV